MKYLALFSSKDKSRNINVLSAAILLGALRVNCKYDFQVLQYRLQVQPIDYYFVEL